MDVNLYAVFVSALASFMFGALWYSPILILPRWCKETGVDITKSVENPARVYGITFLLTLCSAFVLAIFLGKNPDLETAVLSGILAGLGLVVTSMGINYQFANCSLMHWMIDGAFHVFRFAIMGLVLGAWQ